MHEIEKVFRETAKAITDHGKRIRKLESLPYGVGRTRSITFIMDGGGSVIATGIKGDLEIPFSCEIEAWTILADQAGAIKIDVWKDTYANYPPTDADSITNGNEPEIVASDDSAQDTDLSDWTTTRITAGDTLRFNVDSVATITRATLSLKVSGG